MLEMAARDGVEGVLAWRFEVLLAGELPDLTPLRAEFAPRTPELPQITVEIPAASIYDALLPSARVDEREAVAA